MEYQIRPLGKLCARTGVALRPGSQCLSVLVEQNGQWERLDFNTDAWTGPPPGTVAYWKCRVPEQAEKNWRSADLEGLLALFEQLLEERQPSREKLLYVLTLVLLQRKRLKLDYSHAGDDGEFLVLLGSRGEGPYEVRELQLDRSELQELQGVLTEQLNTLGEAA